MKALLRTPSPRINSRSRFCEINQRCKNPTGSRDMRSINSILFLDWISACVQSAMCSSSCPSRRRTIVGLFTMLPAAADEEPGPGVPLGLALLVDAGRAAGGWEVGPRMKFAMMVFKGSSIATWMSKIVSVKF